MKVYKYYSLQNALLLRVLFPSLSTPTVNYSWRLLFPRTQYAMTASYSQTYIHTENTTIPYPSTFWELKTSRQKIKNTDWEVNGATTLELKLQLPNFLTELNPAFLNQGQSIGRECRTSLPTVRAGSAWLRASHCTLQSRSISLAVWQNLGNKSALSPGLWQCDFAMFHIFVNILGGGWGYLSDAF